MISRCPSCGAPAPDEARQCRACGWDFVANKKGGQKPELGAGQPKSFEPKVESSPPPPTPRVPETNPFALPVPRNPGPKPGESLFVSPHPVEQPSLPEARRKEATAPEPAAAKVPVKSRSGLYLAALAIGALVLFSGGAIYLMLHSEPQEAGRLTGSSPFGKRSPGDAMVTPLLDERAPSVPPAPARPTATFAQTVTALPVAELKLATASAPAAAPKKMSEPLWVFEGTVYDLLSTRGVYGARLVFVDAQGNEAASIETSADGHYRAAMKPGPPEGYAVRVAHDDYSGKRIDELDEAGSVRKADLKERELLMRAGARSLPWIGSVGKTMRRDMALAPKVSAE